MEETGELLNIGFKCIYYYSYGIYISNTFQGRVNNFFL